MITFYIVRHGETLFNQKHLMQGWCDSPLTNQAIENARALGKRLQILNLKVYMLPAVNVHGAVQNI